MNTQEDLLQPDDNDMVHHNPMIATPTTTNNINTNTTYDASQTSQQQALTGDLGSLSDDSVAPSFKTLLLKHYVNQILAKNEQNNITTDVSITDLQTGELLVGHNLDTEQFAASDNKLAIAALVL
ncbi:MAG TPA: hypothetical protein VLH38_03245, partial [Patescibacteria group bacterium]|nr:hypothetical protein [Patescibacteria group bacterium]